MKDWLVGKSIQRVQYIELNDPEKEYKLGKYHNVDFAVQFVLDNEEIYHFGWNTTFEQFALQKDVVEVPPHLEKYKFRVWEVENDPSWAPFIGKKITDIQFETFQRIWNGGTKIETPTAMKFEFEGMNVPVIFTLSDPVFDGTVPTELKRLFDGHIFISFLPEKI